jgi:hypothetical protein
MFAPPGSYLRWAVSTQFVAILVAFIVTMIWPVQMPYWVALSWTTVLGQDVVFVFKSKMYEID